MALPILAALVPFGVNALRVMLYVSAAKIIVGVLLFFGLQMVVSKVLLDPALATIRGMMTGGPGGEYAATAIAWAGVLRLDDAVSMLLSAWVLVASIKAAKIGLSKVTT